MHHIDKTVHGVLQIKHLRTVFCFLGFCVEVLWPSQSKGVSSVIEQDNVPEWMQ